MLFPLIVAVVLLVVHVTLWSHANAVAQAAAERGAEAAAAFGSSAAEGEAAALSFLASAGQVDGAEVQAIRSEVSVRVSVAGTYPSIFGRLQVHASTAMPVERATP